MKIQLHPLSLLLGAALALTLGAQRLQSTRPIEFPVAQAVPMRVPAGTIVSYAGGGPPGSFNEVPDGWVRADGSEYPRDTPLADAIGTSFGNGNGYSTINLPDLRGRFMLGAALGHPPLSTWLLGDVGGEETHTLTVDEMPSHDHLLKTTNEGGPQPGRPQDCAVETLNQTQAFSQCGTRFTGGDQPHNNMPPFMAVRYLIKE